MFQAFSKFIEIFLHLVYSAAIGSVIAFGIAIPLAGFLFAPFVFVIGPLIFNRTFWNI